MGNSVRLLFNAFFPGAGYGREHYDEQPEDLGLVEEAREKQGKRFRSDLSFDFLRLDMQLSESIQYTGDRSAQSIDLRRQWTRKIERYRWLEGVLRDYKGRPEFFNQMPVGEVAKVNDIWQRLIDVWHDCVDGWVSYPNGESQPLRDHIKEAFDYAMTYPQVLGRKVFNRDFEGAIA